MYICTALSVSFKTIQYSIWCQKRGCICISSKRRTYRLNPHPFCLCTFNILQAEFSKEKGKRFNHTAISTNFILHGGKALLDTSQWEPHPSRPLCSSLCSSQWKLHDWLKQELILKEEYRILFKRVKYCITIRPLQSLHYSAILRSYMNYYILHKCTVTSLSCAGLSIKVVGVISWET